MTPILYSSDEIDFLNNGLGQLVDLYDVDIHEQRNGLLNLTAYYPVNGQHYADISEGNIILAKPSPLDDNHAFRIVSVALDITGYAVMIEADSITYDLTNNLSKTIHMLGDGQAAMTAIQNSTLHPHIFTFYSDITHTSESQLRYVNQMEAIAGTQGSFLQIWGGELKRENRRVAMFNRRGRDNVATFRLGKNIAGLKYTVDVSKLTTEIVPTVTVNSTDVSRTIEGATVQSSRMGNYPLVYSKMVDVSQDVKVDEGDTDDQIKAKINAFAADWFVKSANTGKDLPEVTVEVEVESLQDSADYADKFATLETIGLTDTVTVYVPEYGVNVTAIVNELHYDPIGERVTSLVVGTAKVSFADSNKSALSDLENKVTQVQEQATQAVTSANGKNKIYPGRTKPEHPQEGDTWFWEDGDNSGIKVFKNGDWVDVVDSKTQERITNEVKNAVDTAAAYADKLNSTQAEATNSLADELVEKTKELTKSQQNIASQATAYTDSAVAQATANAQQIAQTTAQNAQQALEEKATTLQQSIDTKVAKNDYDRQTGELTAKVSTAQQTADTATQTIGNYQTSNDNRVKIAESKIEANADAIKSTVSKTEFNEATGKITGSISKLEQRADGFDATVTKVNNLSVGSRNLLLDTSTSFTVTGNNSTNGNFDAQGGRYYLAGGKKVSDLYNQYGPSRYLTFSFDWVASGDTISGWFSPQWNVSPWEGGLGALGAIKPSNANKSGHYKSTVQLNAYGYSTSIATFIRFRQDNLQGTITISNLKLEAGNVPTDWTPAPEDVNTQLAQVKLTADGVYQTVNDPKTGLNTRVSTAEGNFTKVQGTVSDMSTTVKDTADGLTREIENRKTGDNNTLQAGKDFTTSQITSYNTGIQSQFSQTSNALVAQISSLNLLNNSQFEVVNGTLPGWHVDTPWGATVKVGDTSSETVSIYGPTGDGSVSLHHNHAVNNTSWLYSDPIPASGGQTFSGSFEIVEGGGWNTSAQVTFARYIRFFDANKTLISNAAQNYYGTQIGASWPRYTFTVTTPSNTAFVAFGAGWNGGRIAFRRFAMYAGSTDYGYMPSSKSGNQTVLQLFKDNWSIGIKDNAGNLINGINGDTSGMTIAAKKLTVSADTTFLGNNWLNGAIIKNASIGSAQIAKASITDANILNLDVNKISGNVANFIRTYWDGRYGSTSIDSDGMTISAGLATTTFDKDGMKFEKSNRSVGRIGVNDLYQDFSKKGLYFGLESTGDFMAWGAQNYAGNPYTTKLSWFRAGAVPSNLPGLIEGFNFEDNVAFINPVEMRGGIKLQGANDRLLVRASNLNGGSYPTFGGPSAYFVYAGSDIYLSSNGTAINLTKIAKAFGGIRTAAIPTGFNSNGTATGWYNVDMG